MAQIALPLTRRRADDPARIVVGNANATETPSADAMANVLVRMSNPSSQTVTVEYFTADNTATAGSDYLAAAGTLVFNPGETDKNFAITVRDDAEDEAVETAFINIRNPVNAVIGSGRAPSRFSTTTAPHLC